jgi:hypothetical protein
MCGFKPPPKPHLTLKTPQIDILPDAVEQIGVESSSLLTTPGYKTQRQQAQFYRVVDRRQSELLPEPVDVKQKVKPQWLEQTGILNPNTVVPLNVTPPEKEPLVAWSKLWPVLRTFLSEQKRTRQPDMPRIVRTIAHGHWLERIPRKTRLRWTASVHIMIERAERTCLFNQDYNRLLEQLKQLRGVTGLELQRLLGQPGGRVRVEGKQRIVKDWHVPAAGTTIFILSDLGLLDESGIAKRAWLRLGEQLRLAGCRPVVLLPLPERYLTPELVALFDCMSWDRGSKLQKVVYVPPLDVGERSPLELDSNSAEDLLAWLSSAVRVEPALLRAVRHQLPIQAVDVGQEAAAWHHEDVIRSNIGFHFQPQKKIIEKYRKRFTELCTENPELAIKIAGLIYEYHKHVFPTQRYEEVLLLAALLGDKVPFLQEEIAQARQHMCELVKAGWEQADVIPGIRPFLLHQLERQHDAMIRNNDFYQVVWGFRQHERGQLVGMELPEGFDPRNVLTYVDARFGDNRDYVLFQQGHQALQLSTRQRFQAEDDNGFTTGSALASFTTASTLMFRQLRREDGKVSNMLLPLRYDETVTLPLEEREIQQVDIAGQSLTIERFQKPKWADSIRYGKEEISVVSGGVTYYWINPVWRGDGESWRGFWFYQPDNTIRGTYWAESTGIDQYGVYADVIIAGMPQRFRWIEPTAFQMGEENSQHQVILTQGYWLAETACTQALWKAVMGDNPSAFKGENNPVENVSWQDFTDKFLKRVNKQYPQLKLRLPTEAEWENACRAGTSSLYSFGDEITKKQANFDASKMTKVKSYAPNQWGLYEMHGNVWEWCQDWYDSYPEGDVIDSQGSEIGSRRVLRGGSWFADGRHCRSAFRDRKAPNARSDLIGFRLALDHGLSPVRSVKAVQQPIGNHARKK